MNLEARLHALADDAFPPTPDLAAAWLAKPVPQTGFANRRRRWWVPAALAAVLVPAGTVAAVEVWGPESVELRSVDRLPAAPERAQQRGEEVGSLAEAAQRAGFTPRIPPLLDEIRAITVEGRIVTFRAGTASVTELPGELVVEKMLVAGTKVDRVRYDGAEALFIRGTHDVIVETARGIAVVPRERAGPTLVYERDGIVIRIEGLTAPPRSPAP